MPARKVLAFLDKLAMGLITAALLAGLPVSAALFLVHSF